MGKKWGGFLALVGVGIALLLAVGPSVSKRNVAQGLDPTKMIGIVRDESVIGSEFDPAQVEVRSS